MWKVTNDLNKSILNRYEDIIISFFNLVITLSKDANKNINLELDNFLEAKFEETDNLDPRLLRLNKSANNRIAPLIKKIILLDPIVLEEQFEIYKIQKKEILNKNYNIEPREHPNCLSKIFKDYFYDKFFGIAWIWTDLVGKEYTRGMFKENFKNENKLYVCPYCDSDTISNERNAWIEHFLPKSKFPYLSCNYLNLSPSCTSCNVSGSGKGEDLIRPIVNQYITQIGDKIEFKLENGIIEIVSNADEQIENFIKLLKLRKRYSEKSVNNSVLSVLKTNYNIVLSTKRLGEFDEETFIDFLHDIGRINGYYFVQKNIFKYIDDL